MKITGAFSFSPSLWPTLATLLLLPLLLMLGWWQLERAAQKRMLLAEFAHKGSVTIPLPRATAASRYQRVSVSGRYDGERQFLLDAMPGSAGAGFHVLSVLEVEQAPGRLLINRGWIPASPERSKLPKPAVPEGIHHLTGRLNHLPRPGLRLGEPDFASDGWPVLVLYPTIEDLERVLGAPLYPLVLLLDSDAPTGYERNWSPVNFGPERHLAYAVQWFALALALVVIFVIVNTRRERPHDTRA